MAAVAEDPHLGSGPDEDEDSLLGNDSDSDSILSDDSVLPEYEPETRNGRLACTLYQACASNEPTSLRRVLERGVTKEEVMEVDINGWVKHTFIIQKIAAYMCYNVRNTH